MAVTLSMRNAAVFDDLADGDESALPFEAGPFPPVQIWEDDSTVHVRASVPGVDVDRITVELFGGFLILSGVLPAPRGFQRRVERPAGPFRREIRLPCPVQEGPVEAVMRNGVLTVTLPKRPMVRRRSIPVAGDSL